MSLAPDRSTLARVLEPEVMDSPEDARDYDAMDHGEVNRRFAVDFLAALQTAKLREDVEILDLGTGTAQIPIELCTLDEHLRVLAVDLAVDMLALAGDNIKQAKLSSQIGLQLADAKDLPFDDGRFAAVMSNSIVHHIPEPRQVVAEAVRVLEPGGLIFIRDLARPHDLIELTHLVKTYAADCSQHQRRLYEDSLHAALAIDEVRQIVADLGFDPQSVQATSDRHWTWSAVRQA